jgi:hypothetical protein
MNRSTIHLPKIKTMTFRTSASGRGLRGSVGRSKSATVIRGIVFGTGCGTVPSPLTEPFGSLAQVRRRLWAPKCSIPICFDDCSTIDQTAQSLSVSRLILPDFEAGRPSKTVKIQDSSRKADLSGRIGPDHAVVLSRGIYSKNAFIVPTSMCFASSSVMEAA